MIEQSQANEPAAPVSRPQAGVPALSSRLPYVTYGLLGLTVVIYALQLILENALGGQDWLTAFGARSNEWIRAGEIWRLITPVFLHASPPHLLFNMYALYVLGTGLELNFGHGRFFCLYILGAFSGNVLSFFFSNDNSYSVGASTAIFGLVAAEGIFLFQNRKWFGRHVRRGIGNIIFIVAINLFIGLTPGIDNWGHIGGLLGGLIFTSLAGPLFNIAGEPPAVRLLDGRTFRDTIIGAATVITIFGALAVWGMISA